MKSVAIIGYGYVGRAMARFFEKHYKVFVYDIKPVHLDNPDHIFTQLRGAINTCDLGVICVPTPMLESGECDISAVDDTVEWLATPQILLKSTVPPGTTDMLQQKWARTNLVFSPEFCGESSYWTPYDFHTSVVDTPWFIFGGKEHWTNMMVETFLPIAGPTKRYFQLEARAAEMVKYVENCFYATKIAFCYEMAELCHALDINWNVVREAWLADPRINPMHTAVMAENDAPFGGKCFPKDLAALIALGDLLCVPTHVLHGTAAANVKLGRLRRDRR